MSTAPIIVTPVKGRVVNDVICTIFGPSFERNGGGGGNWGVLEACVPVGVTLSLQNHPALVEKKVFGKVKNSGFFFFNYGYHR